jgi:hypothetical protein
MEKSRKPKGSEGGDLQIRNLDADTLQCLQELKEYFKVGTSSKAVLLAIKNFIPYIREIRQLRIKLKNAEKTIREQWQLFSEIENHFSEAGKVLDEAKHNKMMFDVLGLDEVAPLPDD